MTRIDPDIQFVERARDGDASAVGKLYEQYVKPLYAFCYRQVGNVEEAEDLTQEIFMASMGSLKSFKFESTFRTWLYQVARHHIMDHWRRVYRQKTLPLEKFLNTDLDREEQLFEEDLEELVKDDLMKTNQVDKIFESLPENYRQVLELRFLKNYTLKETAQEMGKTVNNIKVLQYRALRKATVVADQLFGDA